ncbi:MAG: phosphatase PAP2 family protein [Ferruginibacter sp.]|nr:phosphatase PAP2 family protein [Cytophagales bacterium]
MNTLENPLSNHLGKFASILAVSLGLLVLSGCEKKLIEPEYTPDYPALRPPDNDVTGGTWKQVLLGSPAEITVPEPAATNSAAYQQEVQILKTAAAERTDEQTKAVVYWSSGGALRWNEIARQLVTKYNVAPSANADGTFPAFDPTNPFANPPYAARAYALLSVAQYDALVSAWHYKFKYGRVAPKRIDNSLPTLVPDTDLPAYPSEDAVVAAASLEVLKFLFPKEADYLTQLADQHTNSRRWAGANVPSDLEAGAQLGKAVAAKVVAYARTDKMGNARDPNGTYADPQYTAPSWKSMEIPARLPMLPLFGAVTTWFNRASYQTVVPPPPPKVGTPEFEAALREVRKIADTRTREQWRIADFWADGAGTYAPPGHWNKIAADLIRRDNFTELRTARALALLNRAVMDAGINCWSTKYLYYVPRPIQLDPAIKTSTGTPNFPSYTSGHATFSGAAAVAMGYIFPAEATRLDAMAEEAALSRLYGGIHYRFDNDAGLACGKAVGRVAVDWAKGDGAPQ